MKTIIGNVIYNWSKDKKGHIIYKSVKVTPFKQDGTLKKEYKELPKYNVITQYESHTKKLYDEEVLLKSIKELSQKIKTDL